MTKKRHTHRPTGFNNTETNGFFRVAKTDAALAITKRLTASQLRLWLYLMMIDPFADQTDSGEPIYHNIPTPAEIAEKIGASVDTVEKDLRTLKKLKLYEYRITGIQGYNCSAEHADVESQRLKQKQMTSKTNTHKDSACLSPQSAKLSGTSDYLSPENAKLSGTRAYLSREQPPEPLQNKDSSVPQTIQTYSDFINTLSDSERESFVKFGEQKAAQLPQPPQLPQRWIEKNWEELSAQWHKESGKTSKAQTEKWENHPQRQEWIEKIRHLGPLGFQAETNDRDEQKQRRDFALWASDNKLLTGN